MHRTPAQAFYYSVQAGLSIGFGALAETKDYTMAFTIVHVLCGASLVAGALALFMENYVAKSSSRLKDRQVAASQNMLLMDDVSNPCRIPSYMTIAE